MFLCCATLRAAIGFPELPGFFTESTAGVYQARGSRLAVTASPLGVSFGGVALQHLRSAHPLPVGVDPTGGIVNTYQGGRAETGRPAYRAVEYRDLYPGITLRLSFEGRAVKADYLVAAGADSRIIRYRYKGVRAKLDGTDLVAGELRQPAPAVFQNEANLPARYKIGRDGWVRFAIAPHNPKFPMVIDPYVINGSAYFGGAMADHITTMTMDPSGYIYVAGETESTDFPTGSLRPRNSGGEAFVLKVNPANLQVIYATYLGGNAEDRALAIAVDANGSAYCTGLTASLDFPALPYSAGSTDGFVARLTPSGTLQYATFLGGSGLDSANGIAVNPDGSAWVVGDTSSSNMTLHGIAYQSVNRGGQDAFLAKVDANGSFVYTGYFGGSGADRAVAVAVDSAGEVYFTGGTTSGNFPAANAYRNYNSGMEDVFVAKLSADGATLRYSTYLGGSGGVPGQGEAGNWIGVDATGAAVIVGTTGSTNFPMAGLTIQPAFGGGATDAFVAKISPAGTSLLYSTYFGGTGTDEGARGALANGAFYFGGSTSSQGMATVDAVQGASGGGIDGFFVKLSGDLSNVLAFTYLGYTGIDSLSGLAVTPSFVVLAGSSSSPSWLPSGGFKGSYDGWVMTLTEGALSVQMNSSPAGVPFMVSGSGCSPASATTPATLSWANGASCTVSFSNTQGTGDTRTVFQSWADGGSANPRTIVATPGALSYLMQFATEYRLTGTVSPPGAGSVSGAGSYYSVGTVVPVSASANAGYQFSGWSGDASGASNPVTVTMDAPKTATANFNVLTTISNPAPVQVTVAGAGCAAGTYSSPVTLAWSPGANCSVSFPGTQVAGDVRWVFSRWNDGSTANPRTLTAVAGSTYTLEWNLEYRLTRNVAPPGTGSISGSDGFYASSATIPLTATAAAGYQFANWSGDASGVTNPLSVAMNGPKTITANFTPRVTQITIDSNVSSPQFTVSGTGCSPGTYTAPMVLSWVEGSVCNISTPSVQGGDVRWIFEDWADGPVSNPRAITAPATAVTYTMRFGTQYRLTRSATGQGTVTGSDGFYAAGTSVQLTAAPSGGYQFTGWSGSIVSATNPLTFTLDAPSTITANFSASPAAVSILSNVTAQVTVAGPDCPAGTYTTPATVTWTNGTSCTITATSPQGGPDTRLVFANWTDGFPSNSRAITASPGASYTISFTTEHRLTRTTSGQGSISGSDGFYAAGSTVQLTANPTAGFQFTGWTGSLNSAANPLSVLMDGPKSVTANFTAAGAGVRIESNIGVSFSVSGTGCPAGTYTAPATVTWTTGLTCSISVLQPDGGPDSRWAFSRWLDGPATNPRVITASPGAVYTIVMAIEYRLTRLVTGQGSVSGSDGFYAAGSTVQLTASPAAGYQFAGWSGSASGSANPINVGMDGPKSVTATFTAVPSNVRIESNSPVTFNVSGSGCPAGAYTAPVTITWLTGIGCTFVVQQPAAGMDARWTFSRWADGPAGNPRSIVASPGAVYTIVMAADYRLTRLVSGQGSVNGSDDFYPAGSTVQLTATPAAGYLFANWSGSTSGTANPLSIVMDSAKTITANFSTIATGVRIETNVAVQFHVSGAGCPAGTYTAPATITWNAGVACDVSIPSPQGGPDTRWAFSRWSDGSTANSRSIVASAGAVYTLVMSAEYRLSRGVSGPGGVTGVDGFYTAGSPVQLTATPAAGYQFAGWSGSASGAANPLTIVMNGPKSITANFTSAIVSVRIDSNIPAQFTVSGPGCPVGAYTTPVDIGWSNGAGCSISPVSPQGGADSRLVFSRWTDGSVANPRGIVAMPGAVYTLAFGLEHRLTRSVTGQGSVSGADGFYAAGSTVQLAATPAAGYQFAGWSGSGGGATNPLTVQMDGPVTMIANFTAIPGPAVGTLNPLVGSGPSGTFTATFSHGAGAGQLYLGYMLFLPTSNVVNYVAKGSCLVEYNRISHGMRLIDDPGTGWLGPISGVVIRPGAGTLSNKQCTVNVAGSSASVSGNNMTVTVPVTFKNAVSPTMGTFLQAQDVTGRWTGMTQFGNWVLSSGTSRPGPSIVGVANSTNTGTYAVYTITAAHTSGAHALGMIHLLLGSNIIADSPCQVVYFPGNKTLNLINDTGSALVSPTGVTPGTPGSIANSRCSINTGLAAQSASHNAVTVTVPLNLQPSTFGGLKKVYVNAFDNAGLLTHWVQSATLNVQ